MEGGPKSPSFSEQNKQRARTVVEMINSGRFKSVPEAVRQVLINERVTHEPDIQRIMKELGPVIPYMENIIADEQDFLHSRGEFSPDFEQASQRKTDI